MKGAADDRVGVGREHVGAADDTRLPVVVRRIGEFPDVVSSCLGGDAQQSGLGPSECGCQGSGEVEGTVAGEADYDNRATGAEAVEDLRRFSTAGWCLVHKAIVDGVELRTDVRAAHADTTFPFSGEPAPEGRRIGHAGDQSCGDIHGESTAEWWAHSTI